MLFCWQLGKDIAELHAESWWGSGFFETPSRDLKKEILNAKSFSPRNLRYMKRFYELFPVGPAILPQLVPSRFLRTFRQPLGPPSGAATRPAASRPDSASSPTRSRRRI
ncbi:hypothetical protein I6E04_00020 [Collinsella tanakaei]|nr:hypothetical protein [Collinsella tanakaei]